MPLPFDQQESSREQAKPVLLYFIRYGQAANNFYAYTDHEEPITIGPVTYTPEAVKHSGIRQTGTLDNAQATLTMRHDIDLSLRYRQWPPSEVISLVIRQGHADGAEYPVVWSGRILGSKLNGQEEAVFSLERINTSMLRVGLRRKWGEICPLLLYGQGQDNCNADREAATTAVEVVNVAGSIVTLGGAWAGIGNKDKYVNGTFTWFTQDGSREVRSIMQELSGNRIRLGGPAIGLLPGMASTVTLGCNHLLDDCGDLHHNSLNYGGQWLIPSENVVGVKNIWY